MFDAQRDYLATDYVKARVQGLDPNDFYAWTETYIRLSDVSTQSVTAFDSKQYDDFKEILFPDRSIDYIPVGAYVETMGSIWLVVNPSNMGTATANTVIARCRAHYNFYDAYGNILQEPLVVDRRAMLSNRKENPSNIELHEGYFNVKCQINENTMKITDNTRFILGRNAFHVTGLTDFFEEFTFDDESAHIMTFTIRREEPQVNDDMEKRIADGLLYKWSMGLNVPAIMHLKDDTPVQLEPKLIFNGEIMKSSEETPLTWEYKVISGSGIQVSETGLLSATGSGMGGMLSITLKENPKMTKTIYVSIVSGTYGRGILSFNNSVPATLTQYSSVVIQGVYLWNNAPTDYPLEWEFSQADPDAYTAVVGDDHRSATITCLSPSEQPLEIKISYGSQWAATHLKLQGY